MITRRRILLLETGLMFLIHNHKSKSAEGKKDAAAYTHYDIVRFL